MIHHFLKIKHDPESSEYTSSAHWAIGKNNQCILLQVDDGLEQARVMLTPEEAIDIAIELLTNAQNFNEANHIENHR
jgi:hypothetical protein